MGSDLQRRRVLIVGLARSGIAAARFAAQAGATVVVTDRRAAEDLAPAREALAGLPIAYHLGTHDPEDFVAAELIVASPGVPLQLPALAAAQQRGIPIVSEVELALQACPCPVIAITGTNGKSTTTALLGAIFTAAGHRVVVAGNIGTPVLDHLAALATAEYLILEVSSYQIEITPSLQPVTTILLNMTPDHLDRYGSFAAYIAAKQLLVDRLPATATLIYNGADPIVSNMSQGCRARGIDLVPHLVTWQVAGCALVGSHNLENITAAALAARQHGIGVEVIRAAIKKFPGLPHRCQHVAEWRGIHFYNDSKGTNVGAVAKSLAGFTQPVILIAGGVDKGTGYRALRESVQQHVKGLVLLGAARAAIHAEFQGLVPIVEVANMHEAVAQAIRQAQAGDVVLLSPACASFDQYRDYAHRGDDFVQAVQQCTRAAEQVSARMSTAC